MWGTTVKYMGAQREGVSDLGASNGWGRRAFGFNKTGPPHKLSYNDKFILLLIFRKFLPSRMLCWTWSGSAPIVNRLSNIETVLSRLSNLENNLSILDKNVTAISNSQSFINNEFGKQKKTIESLIKRNTALEKQIDSTSVSQKDQERKSKIILSSINDLEQYGRRDMITINGIPHWPKENTDNLTSYKARKSVKCESSYWWHWSITSHLRRRQLRYYCQISIQTQTLRILQ